MSKGDHGSLRILGGSHIRSRLAATSASCPVRFGQPGSARTPRVRVRPVSALCAALAAAACGGSSETAASPSEVLDCLGSARAATVGTDATPLAAGAIDVVSIRGDGAAGYVSWWTSEDEAENARVVVEGFVPVGYDGELAVDRIRNTVVYWTGRPTAEGWAVARGCVVG